jgi:hypothetical protein
MTIDKRDWFAAHQLVFNHHSAMAVWIAPGQNFYF